MKSVFSSDDFPTDSLSVYAKEVGRRRLLSREEEAELGARAFAGDREAINELVEANLRFVVMVAKRYRNRGVEFVDLIQAGNRGLIQAAEKFDPSFGNRFVSYGIHWIKQQIQLAIDAGDGNVRPTMTQMVRVRRVRRLQRQAKQELGREYSMRELMEITGYTEDRITEALEYQVIEQSLDAPLNPHEKDSASLDELLPPAEDEAEEKEAEAERKTVVSQWMGVLTDRERFVLEHYHGINNRRESSLNEIGMMLGVSRERARQIKEEAHTKLRAAAVDFQISDIFTPASGMIAA